MYLERDRFEVPCEVVREVISSTLLNIDILEPNTPLPTQQLLATPYKISSLQREEIQ